MLSRPTKKVLDAYRDCHVKPGLARSAIAEIPLWNEIENGTGTRQENHS